jgi:hypothetical protein
VTTTKGKDQKPAGPVRLAKGVTLPDRDLAAFVSLWSAHLGNCCSLMSRPGEAS